MRWFGAKIREMSEKYNLGTLRPVKTPYLSRKKYTSDECPPAGKELDKMKYPYLSLLMTIAWIAMHYRVELLFIVSAFRQFQQNPSENHWEGLVRIAQFLISTADQGMLPSSGTRRETFSVTICE